MKRGQILGILALLLVCAITVIPVIAENITTSVPSTRDAATDYYNYAAQLTASGNYTDAIALYDKALGSNTTEIQESDALLYIYQGKSYAQIQLGNYTSAIDTLNTGLAVYPTDENLWNNKGYAQFRNGDYKDAVTSYNNALANDANFTTALVNKGDALEKMGNYQDAVTAYTAALAGNPGSNETQAKLANAQNEAAAAQQTNLIIIGVIVIIAIGGVAYYVLKKRPANATNKDKQPDKTGSKKNRKK
ncbi:tetratricopeptide repeat protein [Methanoregula sp.]|uniref:tetratricopeptide repeat protein n=1 Tax=Methanoregula sp. TaxID=2052170 RepID=UPI002BE0FFC4|nr:tetratricopeptide repeat protein [Methanoregula sp.]HVP96982.1 tetratricopeptide repeat protein [Methanoregula sp.]